MVIDDSNTIRRSAEIFLLQAGCTVILAEDGFDALAKIADHEPDLIFVDIMMPRLDGYQTCALIKKNTKFQGMPVIMLSSKDGLFDRARGRMVGSDQYLETLEFRVAAGHGQATPSLTAVAKWATQGGGTRGKCSAGFNISVDPLLCNARHVFRDRRR